MFTHFFGYTALMGEDEQKASKLLQKNRNLQILIIEEHRRRWIKEPGDALAEELLCTAQTPF